MPGKLTKCPAVWNFQRFSRQRKVFLNLLRLRRIRHYRNSRLKWLPNTAIQRTPQLKIILYKPEHDCASLISTRTRTTTGNAFDDKRRIIGAELDLAWTASFSLLAMKKANIESRWNLSSKWRLLTTSQSFWFQSQFRTQNSNITTGFRLPDLRKFHTTSYANHLEGIGARTQDTSGNVQCTVIYWITKLF